MRSVELIHCEIKVSASQISLEILEQHVHFFLGEAAAENAEMGMSEIQEQHITRYFRVKIRLPENAVI